MTANAEQAIRSQADESNDLLPQLLRGYRFAVCTTAEAAARALEVRRQVYVNGNGYSVPVPDEYDARSWFLLAEDVATGQAVGSMRLTPRLAGPFEAEEYFRLPRELCVPKAVELNRFAILPAYRKGKTFLPIVSFGLFRVAFEVLNRFGARWMVIASKPERIWTYEWLRFARTGLVAPYGKLDYSEHELLSFDFPRQLEIYQD
ncbi:MAG: GNAT family N-acyltransferase, partial [Thermoanaerobaculia bacterium]